MSPRQLPRHPLRFQNTYSPQFCGPSQSAIAYKTPPPRDRRTTSRPTERADVHVRRQHPKNQITSDPVVCRQHTEPTTTPPLDPTIDPHTSSPFYQPNSVNISSNLNLPPTYKHVLLRDRPAHARTADNYNPRSLGTALEPSLGRGLQTPLVLAAPWLTTDMGRAANLSTRIIDQYRCDRPAPSHSKAQSSTQGPLPLAYVNTLVNNEVNLILFSHLNASQRQCCKVRPIMCGG
jgi:hypothetical protein